MAAIKLSKTELKHLVQQGLTEVYGAQCFHNNPANGIAGYFAANATTELPHQVLPKKAPLAANLGL